MHKQFKRHSKANWSKNTIEFSKCSLVAKDLRRAPLFAWKTSGAGPGHLLRSTPLDDTKRNMPLHLFHEERSFRFGNETNWGMEHGSFFGVFGGVKRKKRFFVLGVWVFFGCVAPWFVSGLVVYWISTAVVSGRYQPLWASRLSVDFYFIYQHPKKTLVTGFPCPKTALFNLVSWNC